MLPQMPAERIHLPKNRVLLKMVTIFIKSHIHDSGEKDRNIEYRVTV